MTIDMSVVRRIAVQCNMALAPSGNGYWDNQDQLLKLAQSCYAMGAQEQKEKCAKVFLENAKGCWTNAEMADTIRKGE